ncbi:MAG: DNA-directed RNA polymerase subunit alpha C-terminal domain-containing protein [Pirellulaceae bacterium]
MHAIVFSRNLGGSRPPPFAIGSTGVKLLSQHVPFSTSQEDSRDDPHSTESAEERSRLQAERLELSIAEMELSVRTTNCLEETGIFTVRDLLNASPKRLLAISNFGEKTLEEVYIALEKLGFYRPGCRPADEMVC